MAIVKRQYLLGFSSAMQYTSSYRPRKTPAVVSNEIVEIQYDRYQFTTPTFTVDTAGNVSEHIGLEKNTIKISCDWRANLGDKPSGGYIAKGLMKYAFLVSHTSPTYLFTQTLIHRAV